MQCISIDRSIDNHNKKYFEIEISFSLNALRACVYR
jgi:hypothetical protein